MFRKIKYALVSIVLVAVAFGGVAVALAASSTPAVSSAASSAVTPTVASSAAVAAATGTQWAMGQISAIGSDNFTVQGPVGALHVVYVNDQTKYLNHDAQAGKFAGLQVGDRVLGAANVGSDGKSTAILVIDFGAKTGYRGIGVASAVNSSDQSFTFVGRKGAVWEFYTDANTKITDRQGNAKSFSDIQPGTRLFVHAEKRAGGKWWALEIKVGKTVPPAAATTQN